MVDRSTPPGSLFSDPQEKPLEKFLRVTMTLPGARTRQLREEAKDEYERLLAAEAKLGLAQQTITELQGRLAK